MAIDVLTVGEGQFYPLAFGEHIVSGHLLVKRELASQPLAVQIALGLGVWGGYETIWHRGEPLPTDAIHFHPGIPSSGNTDPVQGIDSWFPGAIPYSGVAYVSIQFPGEAADVDVSQVVGRYKCLVIEDYDDRGNITGTSVSANPARVAAYLWLKAAKRKASRINWGSWKRWRDACEQAIEWNDGTKIQSIPRFTAHVAFTSGVSLQSALNFLCDLSATNWQDDGKEVRFINPFERTPVFNFEESSNVIRNLTTVDQLDSREAPNRIKISFRDLQNPYLSPASWTVELEDSIAQRGLFDLGTISYGPMHYSQAQRIGKYLLRVQGSSQARIGLDALPVSYPILAGDTGTITHSLVADTTKNVLVLETTDDLTEAATRHFACAILEESLYNDSDQEPIPQVKEVV